MYNTARYGDKWLSVTTLPMLYAGYPLYVAGGYRLALLLPMLGSVLAGPSWLTWRADLDFPFSLRN